MFCQILETNNTIFHTRKYFPVLLLVSLPPFFPSSFILQNQSAAPSPGLALPDPRPPGAQLVQTETKGSTVSWVGERYVRLRRVPRDTRRHTQSPVEGTGAARRPGQSRRKARPAVQEAEVLDLPLPLELPGDPEQVSSPLWALVSSPAKRGEGLAQRFSASSLEPGVLRTRPPPGEEVSLIGAASVLPLVF